MGRVAAMVTAFAVAAGAQDARRAVPTDADVQAGLDAVREAYRIDDERAVERSTIERLVRRLLDDAASEPSDRDRYAMADEARRLSCKVGAVALAWRATEQIAAEFEVDGLGRHVATLDAIEAGRLPDVQPTTVLERRVLIALRAIDERRFDLARRQVERSRGLVALDRSAFGPFVSRRVRWIDAMCRRDARAEEVRERLDREPADPAANADYGSFLCLALEHWDGLELLARGADEALAKAARLDLAAPTTPASCRAVGDAWWSVAAVDDESRTVLERRAAEWYSRALASVDGPELSALQRKQLDSRIDRVRAGLQTEVEEARSLWRLGWGALATWSIERLVRIYPSVVPASVAAEFSGPPPAVEASIRVHLPVTELYALRRDPLGKSRATTAVERALQWLAGRQRPDGSWRPERDSGASPASRPHGVGVTGLALLAFLAAGTTPDSGEHRDSLARGLEWLVAQQDTSRRPETNGRIGSKASNSLIYNHLFAALALAEAYGTTGSSELRAPVERAVRFTASFRTPGGAWRYQRRDNDADTSVTVLAWMVLRAARDFGIAVEPSNGAAVRAWIDRMTDPRTGRAGYTERGGTSSRPTGARAVAFPRANGEAMTAAALFGRFLLGQTPDRNPIMTVQAELVRQRPPTWDAGHIDFYYWFYASHALRQVGGATWSEWRTAVEKILVRAQRRDGADAGSWDPVGVWGEHGGRVYTTAIAALTLLAPTRYAELTSIAPVPDAEPFGRARRAWLKRKFESVRREATRLAGSGVELTAAEAASLGRLESELAIEIQSATARLVEIEDEPDYLTVESELKAIAVDFGALEPGRHADAVLKRLKTDVNTRRELKAAGELRRILRTRSPSGLRKKLERFVAHKAHAGTAAATRAGQQLKRLEK